MAQFHGNIANYPAEKRREMLGRMFILVFIVAAVAAFFVGLSVGSAYVQPLPAWAHMLVSYGGTVFLILFYWRASRWFKRNEPAFFQHVKGAAGEAAVADELKKLPAGFHVIHGLQTANGDVDHLVIGPTGVFALDAKKWSAHISVDQHGNLLRNGTPMDEDHVGKLKRRVMLLRDMLITPEGPDPFVQGALVFVESKVQIERGQLRYIDALTPDDLNAYLTRPRSRKLSSQEVELLAARAASHVRA